MSSESKEEKKRAYQKAYYEANKEKIKARAEERKRKEEKKEKAHQYYLAYVERIGREEYNRRQCENRWKPVAYKKKWNIFAGARPVKAGHFVNRKMDTAFGGTR